MKKKAFSRIISAVLAAMIVFVLTADQAFFSSVSADQGTHPDYVTGDNYDDLKLYKLENKDLYYSDSYFAKSSTGYDPHLATLSMVMADRSAAFGSIKEGATDAEIDEWCKNQTSALRKFFSTIEFEEFDCNEDFKSRSDFSTIGVAAALKKIKVNGEDCTVIAVVPRSGSYFREWANNVWLGDGSESDYMHEGWYNAAKKLISFLQYYVKSHNVTGRVKLWMAGFSRGGATTNIAAGLIDNMIDRGKSVFDNGATLVHDDVFAYTFEAPQGANVDSKTVKAPKDAIYNNIWNIVNPNDLVTKVAMSEYGFTRFGTDRFITTKFFDNAGFEENRRVFAALYTAIGKNYSDYHADDFEMYGFPIEQALKLIAGSSVLYPMLFTDSILVKDTTKANYDANIAEILLLEEATSHIGSRQDYCKKLQEALSEMLYHMNNDQEGAAGKEAEKYKGIVTALFLSPFNSSQDKIAELLEQAGAGERDVINTIFPALPTLIKVISETYWENPNELFSIGKYVSEIFQNHDMDVIFTHMQAQDSYYIDAYNKTNTSGDQIMLVPLRENADMVRMSFFGFNDLGLRSNGIRFASIDGTVMGKSSVGQCDGGYACGYYSYATEETMELFAPAGVVYNISMKSYSKKIAHRVEYWANIQYNSLGSYGRIRRQLDHYLNGDCWFNSDRIYRDVDSRI